MASSSALASSLFLVRRAANHEHIASVGLVPPVVSLFYSVEAVIVDQFLDEVVAELVGAAVAAEPGADAVVDPFLVSPPPLSPFSDSGGSVVGPALEVDDGVPGLVLARALVPFSAAPVTPPVALPPVVADDLPLRVPRRARRWASCVLFPHGDAVAAVRAVQREDVVWYNGDVRLLPLPAPPSPPPRRSLRLLRRRLQ